MVATVTVDTTIGQRKLHRVLEHVDERQLLQAVGNRQLRWVDQNFRAHGLESHWRPLKPETVKRRRLGSSEPLQNTGRLRASFTARPRKAGDDLFTVTGNTVTVGTNVEYAPPHEYGAPDRGIPQRKMLPTRATAKRLAVEVVEAEFEEATRGAS